MVCLLFVMIEHPRAADDKPVSTETYRNALKGELAPSYARHGNFSSRICDSWYALATLPPAAGSSHLLPSSEEGSDFPREQYGQKRTLEAGRFHLGR